MAQLCLYITKSKRQKYYIGETSNVALRLLFHNAGKQRSTRTRIPFTVVLSEQFETREVALQREKQIKNWKGGNAFKALISGI